MYHHLRRRFGVTLCLLGLASPLVCAAAPPSTPSPAAQLVAVQGASHPYRLMDYDHRVVTAAVPAQALTDVQTLHPDGTVQATVATIDFATGRIQAATDAGDRKSTRLNSSHMSISYAVFCLKKKKKTKYQHLLNQKKKYSIMYS